MRGRYFERHWKSRQVRVLDPDLAKEFGDSQAVNEALRQYLRLKRESASRVAGLWSFATSLSKFALSAETY